MITRYKEKRELKENESTKKETVRKKRHCDASVENHEKITGRGRVLVRALIRELLLGSSSSRFLIQRRTRHSTPSLDEIPVNSLTRKSTAGSQSSWRGGGERCKNDRWETSICNNATDDKTAIV